MKSFLKFGSLFALILAGRYMQSVAPVGAGLQRKAPMALFAPAPPAITHYVGYSNTDAAPVLPANHRSQPKPEDSSWY